MARGRRNITIPVERQQSKPRSGVGLIALEWVLLFASGNDPEQKRRFQRRVRRSTEGHPVGRNSEQDEHLRNCHWLLELAHSYQCELFSWRGAKRHLRSSQPGRVRLLSRL